MPPLVLGSLFTGIGGFDLAARRCGIPVAFMCEIDPFCRAVLCKQFGCVPVERLGPAELVMYLVQWRVWRPGTTPPPTILYGDVKTFAADCWRGIVSLLCGGYPCQPESHAGQRRGAADDRWLWPEMRRLYCAVRPRWVVGENVYGHVSLGLDGVLADLEADGYETWPLVIPACAAGACHRRDRVWVVVHANDGHCAGNQAGAKQAGRLDAPSALRVAAHAHRERCQQPRQLPQPGGPEHPRAGGETWWPAEPALCVADDGLPGGLVRRERGGRVRGWRSKTLRAAGNALVPQVPEVLFGLMLEIEENGFATT